MLQNVYGPLSTIVHAMACQPAKNAGALTAVYGIKDAVALIHGPVGCAALRKMNSFEVYRLFPHTPCTALKEIELVYGAEEKLKVAIVETYKRYRPSLIVVVPTCPSDMIGDDIGSAVREAKKEINCEVVYSTGELIRGRPIGYHDVVYSIFDQLLEQRNYPKKKMSVNLFTFPVHSSEDKYEEVAEIFNEIGIRINKIFFSNTKLRDIYELPEAELNIADSLSPYLRLIKERFKIPCYITSSIEEHTEQTPYGIEHSAKVILDVARFFGIEKKVAPKVEKRKEEAKERLKEETKALKGVKIAIVGGFLFGIGSVLVKEFGMRPSVLIYRTFGLESHGMSKDSIKKIIDKDLELAKRYEKTPKLLVNPRFEDEISVLKEKQVELVITSGWDTFRYHAEGIKAFDSIKFYLDSVKIGFKSTLKLAEMIKKELKKSPKKSLVSMLEYDPYRVSLHPSWIKLERIWRAVTEGADGGCLYG